MPLPASSAPRRGRFAPSPTGPLHAGSLVAALGSWLMARRGGGAWHVRIEDLDPPREAPGAAQAQLSTLHRLGLIPDGPIVRQSERGALYAAALARLLDAGHAFVCHCSRADLAAHGGPHHACVPGAQRADPAIRLRVPRGCAIAFDDSVHGPIRQNLHADVGDFVLRRADGLWAYQLAVVVDDAEQGITDVVRGLDLLDSTPRQILLQRLLGLPTPAYAHLPLRLDEAGRKLSKSLDATPAEGDPIAALEAAWRFLGQAPLAVRPPEPGAWLALAQAAFRPAHIPRPAPSALAATHNANEPGDA